MNKKYYYSLRFNAELTQKLVNVNPDLLTINKKAKKPTDLLVHIHNIFMDMGMNDKNLALEIAKLLFYGTHKEVNNFYNNGGYNNAN